MLNKIGIPVSLSAFCRWSKNENNDYFTETFSTFCSNISKNKKSHKVTKHTSRCFISFITNKKMKAAANEFTCVSLPSVSLSAMSGLADPFSVSGLVTTIEVTGVTKPYFRDIFRALAVLVSLSC